MIKDIRCISSRPYRESKMIRLDLIRKKIRSEECFLQCSGDIADYRDLTWKIGFRIRCYDRRRKTQFRSVRSPIHFNVINVPIARFVSWSNLHPPHPAPFVHPGISSSSSAQAIPRNKRVARQRHRSVVTSTVCTCVCTNTYARTRARAHAAVYIINAYKYPCCDDRIFI